MTDDVAYLIRLRTRFGLNQGQMADRLGISRSQYSSIELRKRRCRPVYTLAFERVALAMAAELYDPMLLPPGVRKDVLSVGSTVETIVKDLLGR